MTVNQLTVVVVVEVELDEVVDSELRLLLEVLLDVLDDALRVISLVRSRPG